MGLVRLYRFVVWEVEGEKEGIDGDGGDEGNGWIVRKGGVRERALYGVDGGFLQSGDGRVENEGEGKFGVLSRS